MPDFPSLTANYRATDLSAFFRPSTVNFWTVKEIGFFFQIEIAVLSDLVAWGPDIDEDFDSCFGFGWVGFLSSDGIGRLLSGKRIRRIGSRTQVR